MKKEEYKFKTYEGDNNVILVAPHGYQDAKYKDDENTAKLTELLQQQLNCHAIINDQYRKPRNNEAIDVAKGIADLRKYKTLQNSGDKAQKELISSFLSFLTKAIIEAEKASSNQEVFIFHIHGIDDDNINKEGANLGILLGIGLGDTPGAANEKLSAPVKITDDFIRYLKDSGVPALATCNEKYAGRHPDNLNQYFKATYPQKTINSFQLEIRYIGYRDQIYSLQSSAESLSKAIRQIANLNLSVPIEAQADDDLVEEAYSHLKNIFIEKYEKARLDAMLLAGKYIIKTFYNDDYELALLKNKAPKAKSLLKLIEKLQKNSSNAPSKSWIYNAVDLAVDEHNLIGFHTYGKLLISQKVKLLPIKDIEQKKKLITESVDKGLSTRELGKLIKSKDEPDIVRIIGNPALFSSREINSLLSQVASEGIKNDDIIKLKNRAVKQVKNIKNSIAEAERHITQYKKFIKGLSTYETEAGIPADGSYKQKPSRNRSKYQDWVTQTISCQIGCENDCIYCFAKGDLINKRHKEGYSLKDWSKGKLSRTGVRDIYPRYDKTVMCPGTHDFTEENFDNTFTMLQRVLEAGNRVLIVSKPRPVLIQKICDELRAFKSNMLFRFTIGAMSDEILSFWEPSAPSYDDRKKALSIAFEHKYRTSVSIEPMLDPVNIKALVGDLSPFVNQSIWIGTLNHTQRYLNMDPAKAKTDAERNRAERNLEFYGKDKAEKICKEIERINALQEPESLQNIYSQLQDNPIVQWKWDIKEALGIPQPKEPEKWPDAIIE